MSALNEWKETKTETRNPSDGKVSSTKEEGTWKFDVSKAEFALKSGFTWTPSDKVTVDANWDILNAVFAAEKTISADTKRAPVFPAENFVCNR